MGEMEGWRESKFFRVVFTTSVVSTIIGISYDIGGRALDQPWWGALLTVGSAGLAGFLIWRNLRVYERI